MIVHLLATVVFDKSVPFNVILWFFNGAGLSLYLAEDVVNNASIDLESAGDRGGEARSTSESIQKKRKHDFEIQAQTNYSPKNLVPIAVKIAALEALETLLTVVCFHFRHTHIYRYMLCMHIIID